MRNRSADGKTRFSAGLWRLLLVVALIGAWHGSALHPLKHLDDGGRFVHFGGVHSTDDPQPGSDPSSRLCDVLAALGACASSAPLGIAVLPSGHFAFPQFSGDRRSASGPPFLAQGPPLSS